MMFLSEDMYSKFLFVMHEEKDITTKNKNINFDLEDEILKGCVITHQGSIVNESVK